MCGICISISLSLASLTLSLAVRSAPCPIVGRMWRCDHTMLHSVVQSRHSTITERQRKVGQGRDTQHRRREEKIQEQQGGHTEGQGQVRVR